MVNINLFKRLCFVLLLICLAEAVFAIQIGRFGDLDDILDDYTNNPGKPLDKELMDELIAMWERGELQERKDDILRELREEIKKYLQNKYLDAFSNPKELLLGFANASVFASHSATLRGYANYKNFAFAIGAMAGFRLPGGILHPIDDIIDTADNVNNLIDNPDIRLGVNIQAVSSQIGINLSQFLDGLYLGISFTYYMLYDFQDISLVTNSMGLTAHYQLIKGMDAGNGWRRGFKWGGLTAETGLIYSNTVMKGSFSLEDYEIHGFSAQGADLNLNIDIATYTIPLEVYTSAFFLWIFNAHFGAGVDLAFGKNTTSINLDTNISYQGEDVCPLQVNGGGAMSPSLVNIKIFGGLGIKLGSVILDIPLTYYFFRQGSGLSLGVTLGLVF